MPSLDDLLRAYERSLIAKVQLSEFAGWGDATVGNFRREIAAHVELEQAYLREVTERRRSGLSMFGEHLANTRRPA